MALTSIRKFCVLWTILPLLASAVKIWDSPGALGTLIPAGCRAALTTNITCPGMITAAEIVNEVPQNETFLEQYCEPTCRNSLQVLSTRATNCQETRSLTSPQSFATLVNTRCGNTVYSFGNSTKQSGNDIAVPLLWSQNVACLEDS